jgi:MFS family permease
MTTTAFVRDRFTILAYLLLGFYAYMQAVLGPAAGFIRTELNLDFTQQAFHITAYALGMTLAGLTSGQVAAWVGRPAAFWGGGAGMVIGGILISLGQVPVVTVAASFIMGLIGSYLLTMIQATLSDRHGVQRAYALTESNVLASLTAGLAPLAVGQGEALGIGWRVAFLIGVAVWIGLALWGMRLPIPLRPQASTQSTSSTNGKLPRAFWVYALVVFIAVSVEWCMIFWAAAFLRDVVGLSPELSATLVTIFFLAQFAGRFIGSRLTRTMDSRPLLLVAAIITCIGFPLFWLAQVPWLNVVGLFLCGLGSANLYPLTLTISSTVGQVNPNAASGLTSMSAGAAILITPQIMGGVADQIGIQGAYGVLAPFIVGVLIVVLVANRLNHTPSVQAA